MQKFERIRKEELDVPLNSVEEQLEKLLALEPNKADLINENFKLKGVLKRAKVSMWKEHQEVQEENEKLSKANTDLSDQIGTW